MFQEEHGNPGHDGALDLLVRILGQVVQVVFKIRDVFFQVINRPTESSRKPFIDAPPAPAMVKEPGG